MIIKQEKSMCQHVLLAWVIYIKYSKSVFDSHLFHLERKIWNQESFSGSLYGIGLHVICRTECSSSLFTSLESSLVISLEDSLTTTLLLTFRNFSVFYTSNFVWGSFHSHFFFFHSCLGYLSLSLRHRSFSTFSYYFPFLSF